jgi:transposase
VFREAVVYIGRACIARFAVGATSSKKLVRPTEQARPDVQQKRARFLRRLRGVDPGRLVFLDEAAANLSMGRSHAWIRCGEVRLDPRPMNWGTSLTMIGALRRCGWITMSTMFGSANSERFVTRARRRLAPKLRRSDVVILDNAPAHKDAAFEIVESALSVEREVGERAERSDRDRGRRPDGPRHRPRRRRRGLGGRESCGAPCRGKKISTIRAFCPAERTRLRAAGSADSAIRVVVPLRAIAAASARPQIRSTALAQPLL